jgi:hypothetical protein
MRGCRGAFILNLLLLPIVLYGLWYQHTHPATVHSSYWLVYICGYGGLVTTIGAGLFWGLGKRILAIGWGILTVFLVFMSQYLITHPPA